jgi:hypothetical protein
MIPENDIIRQKHNITKWHQKGWKGKRARFASFESDKGEHDFETYFTLGETAPECQPILLPDHGADYAGTLKKYNINIAARALYDEFTISENVKIPADLLENCLFLQAVGNTDDPHPSLNLTLPYWNGIIACSMDLSHAGYSLKYDNALCSAIGTVYIQRNYVANPSWGNTESTYIVAGMLALVDDKAIAETGKPLSPESKKQFIKDYSKNGVFILPDPSVDLSNYEDIDMDKPYIGLPDVKDSNYFATLDDVPAYWREEIQALIKANAINGGTDNSVNDQDVNLTREQTQTVVILKRYIDFLMK